MGRHVTYIDMAGWEREPWWIAHEYPERPVDRHTVWSWDCDACMMHLVASANVAGDLYAEEFQVHAIKQPTTVNDTLAEARAWRAEQGMTPL